MFEGGQALICNRSVTAGRTGLEGAPGVCCFHKGISRQFKIPQKRGIIRGALLKLNSTRFSAQIEEFADRRAICVRSENNEDDIWFT